MAAPYFDATSGADLALLPPSVRGNGELVNVAALAEAAVIGYYTENPPYFLYTAYDNYIRARYGNPDLGDGGVPLLLGAAEEAGVNVSATVAGAAQLRVYLTGYKVDAADAGVDPNLKQALRLTIAQVIRWWITGWGREPGITSSSDAQGKARTYRDNAEDAFPTGWQLLLIPFDARPRAWAL